MDSFEAQFLIQCKGLLYMYIQVVSCSLMLYSHGVRQTQTANRCHFSGPEVNGKLKVRPGENIVFGNMELG